MFLVRPSGLEPETRTSYALSLESTEEGPCYIPLTIGVLKTLDLVG